MKTHRSHNYVIDHVIVNKLIDKTLILGAIIIFITTGINFHKEYIQVDLYEAIKYPYTNIVIIHIAVIATDFYS